MKNFLNTLKAHSKTWRNVVKSVQELQKGDIVQVNFQDGYAQAEIVTTYVQKEGD